VGSPSWPVIFLFLPRSVINSLRVSSFLIIFPNSSSLLSRCSSSLYCLLRARATPACRPTTKSSFCSCSLVGRLNALSTNSGTVLKYFSGLNALASFSVSTNTVCLFCGLSSRQCSEDCSRSIFYYFCLVSSGILIEAALVPFSLLGVWM